MKQYNCRWIVEDGRKRWRRRPSEWPTSKIARHTFSYWFCLCNSATCFSRGSHDAFWIRPQTTTITARVVCFRRGPIIKETVLRSVGTFKNRSYLNGNTVRIFGTRFKGDYVFAPESTFPFAGSRPITTRVTYASKIISDDFDGYTTTVRRRRTSQRTIHLTNTHIRAYIVYDRFDFSIPIVYRVYFFFCENRH